MRLGNVVDQFHDHYCFAHPCSPKSSNFSSFDEWTNQIDYFDTGFQNICLGVLIHEGWGLAVDGSGFFMTAGTFVVYGISNYVEDPTQDFFTHRHGNGGAGILDFHASNQAFGGGHGNRSNPINSQVLLSFKNQLGHGFRVRKLIGDFQRVVDFRSTPLGKFGIHYGADDLNDFSLVLLFRFLFHGKKI